MARVIAIVGATATGKTALAEALAGALGAEIVCADSRQVFRELEVGTGKPDAGERAVRPHHLFDALALGDRASAGWYARACADVRDTVRSRARLPLLVGGSGLYLRAAERGLAQEPPLDAALRERLRAETQGIRSEELHARLAARDPTTAARLAPGDRQRVARALEVLEASGKPLSWWHARGPAPAQRESWKVLELVVDGDQLRARVAHRTRWMMEHGLVEETRALVEAGHGAALRALRAVGYDEVLALLAGEVERDEAEARINQRTARLAKRQRTWFRHQVQATRLEVSGLGEKRLLEHALKHLGAAR